MLQELLEVPDTTHSVILLYFKMKYEPTVSLEKSYDVFVFQSIRFHGAVLFYVQSRSVDQDNDSSSAVTSLTTIYVYHIVGNQTIQDWTAVCSIV